MKNKNKIIIGILLIVIIGLLLWFILSNLKEELIFNISVDKSEIMFGESIKINYELNEDREIKWESSNNDIAKIENGNVIGVGIGNVIIKGTISIDDVLIERSIPISVYYDSNNSLIKDIIIPEGELFITKGDTFLIPIKFEPEDVSIDFVDYYVDNDNIVSYDGIVRANNIGSTNIEILFNKLIKKVVKVNVIEKPIEPTFSKKVEDININSDTLKVNLGESINIDYELVPSDSFIENIEWSSSNLDIATIEDGIIQAKEVGDTDIILIINDNIIKNIKVSVIIPVKEIKLYNNTKLVMKVGQEEAINPIIIPDNATNKNLKYSNSNPESLSIDENGVIKALKEGKGIITVTVEDSDVKLDIEYTVNPQKKVIEGTGDIYGYTSYIDQIPEKADIDFFKNLESEGKGTLNNNIYTYVDGDKTYTYDISKSLLSLNKKTVLTRFYYPNNVDLSRVNTFTFCNGTGNGSGGFVGLMREADSDRSYIKSSGIIIFVASKDGSSYHQEEILLATEFVKAIVNQQKGVKNAIGAYSGSGPEVGYAANKGSYDRVIIFDSYFWPNKTLNLVDKEITVYSPDKDKLEEYTRRTLNTMIKNGYTNVTIISNNSSLIKDYKNSYLVINPGKELGSGHARANIIPANIFSYACR